LKQRERGGAISEASFELHALAKIGYELYCSTLIGGGLESTHQRFLRMQDNRINDLVIELSTAGWWLKGDQPHPGPYSYLKVENAIGFLEKIENEPVVPWDDEEEPAPLEKVFYLKLLHDDSIFRWTNARFATILPVEGWPL
jgi:hypothetical protein